MTAKLKINPLRWFSKPETKKSVVLSREGKSSRTVFSPAKGRAYFITEELSPGRAVLSLHGAFIDVYALTMILDGTRSSVRWGPAAHLIHEPVAPWVHHPEFDANYGRNSPPLGVPANVIPKETKATEVSGLSATGKAVVWHVESEDKARELYAFLSEQIKSEGTVDSNRSRAGGMLALIPKLLLIAAMMFMGGVLFSIFASGGASRANNAVAAQATPQSSDQFAQMAQTAPVPSEIPAEARLTDAEFSQLKDLKGKIVMRATGIPFYIFTDPNCPYCKELEKSLASLSDAYNPIVIPLGYKPGSRSASAGVLCQTTGQPAAWTRRVLNAESAASPVTCEAGLRQVDENQRLFESLRLTATPSMVTPSGLLVAGAVDAQQLSVILAR